ncbi:SDR family NAD(P)-dependent oxidoreductase, partial [Klebsiella pneumoniae]|uniref:SDR family NAD(P)-dependent oxidoreductase n=2 Tax=Bacteria TaxID=2 RepID=UPI0021616079
MQEGVASTVEAITSAGGAATAAETDVTEEASVEALVETAVEAGGHLDVFVANAGIAQVQELIDYDAADFQKILDVN